MPACLPARLPARLPACPPARLPATVCLPVCLPALQVLSLPGTYQDVAFAGTLVQHAEQLYGLATTYNST